MSFETVFEKWLQQKQGGEETETDGTGGQQRVDVACDSVDEDDVVEEEMPVIQREAWREEDMEDMPVLQKMVDLPSVEEERKLRSPPPPPLQITLSLTESRRKERLSKSLKNKPLVKDKAKRLNTTIGGGKNYEKQHLLQDVSPLIDKTKITRVPTGGEQNCCIHKASHQDMKDSDLKEKAHHECQAKSALTELTRLSQNTSPMVVRGSEVDSVRSPECDLTMEPDSTSEFLLGSGRWLRSRKGSETSRGEVSPWGEVSPRSIGYIGLRTASGSSSEMLMRVESSPAECDSTSMFMNSPSAISPASQGEIEERVCPVLADHEDSASPSHCVCRCRSLPPPSDLMARDHTPVAITTTSQLTVKIPNTISCQTKAKSWTTLVSHTQNVDDDPAPDLEKVAPSLDLMAPPDVLQSDHDSPPVLTLPEQETRVKQFSIDYCQTKGVPAQANQQEAPPLIRYEPESPQVNTGDISTSNKYSDSPPVLSSSDFDCRVNCNESPPVLSLHGQEASVKPSKSRRQIDVCDFTSNIDWETAVVETVENPPHLTKYDGESKPGIIIKIRTKGKSATPYAQLVSVPKPVPKAAPIKRKRHTVDNSEMMSRLRKRHKSEVDKSGTSVSAKEEKLETYSVGSKAMEMQHKAVRGNARSYPSCTMPKDKKLHCSTVQLGDLKVSTQDLSPKHSAFAQSSVELCRLQTVTHELVYILFPHLRPHLNHIAPDSRGFIRIIEDIILSLECSTSEEIQARL